VRWGLRDEDRKALKEFPARVSRETRIRLKGDQWEMKVEPHPQKKGDYMCTVKLAYVIYTDWPLITDWQPTIPKIKSVYRWSLSNHYRKDY
jgi:hypothetical protein